MPKEEKKVQPVAKFRDGGLQISIWKQKSEKGSDYHTALVSPRSYFDDASKDFKETQSMKKQHLLSLAKLCEHAYDKIVELDAEQKNADRE